MDLQVVRKGEKVQVEVPVVLVGESVAGTQHQQEEAAPAFNLFDDERGGGGAEESGSD